MNKVPPKKFLGGTPGLGFQGLYLTGDTALRLGHFFGTSAQFWLNLQSLYELRLAQQKAGKSITSLPTLKRPEYTHA